MQEHLYDKEDMKHVIHGLAQQIRDAYSIHTNIRASGDINKIIVCGMGGSGISGHILEEYLNLEIPIFNIHNYSIPKFADKHSLIFVLSYSGNTEESISCYREALKHQFHLVVITTGGKLKEYCQNNHTPHILIPKGLQPRNAVAYLFFPMLKVLENSGIIGNRSEDVKKLLNSLSAGKESYERAAKDLAEKLHGKLPIIYSSDNFYAVAYRWKCEMNENAKIPAFCHRFPELNHNELNGYVNYDKLNIPMHIIILKDEHDIKRIIKRMDITKKLIKELSNDKIKFTEIRIKGDSMLSKIFTTIYLGDLVSYYLALKYVTDPTPVKLIEQFKDEMGSYL